MNKFNPKPDDSYVQNARAPIGVVAALLPCSQRRSDTSARTRKENEPSYSSAGARKATRTTGHAGAGARKAIAARFDDAACAAGTPRRPASNAACTVLYDESLAEMVSGGR